MALLYVLTQVLGDYLKVLRCRFHVDLGLLKRAQSVQTRSEALTNSGQEICNYQGYSLGTLLAYTQAAPVG